MSQYLYLRVVNTQVANEKTCMVEALNGLVYSDPILVAREGRCHGRGGEGTQCPS